MLHMASTVEERPRDAGTKTTYTSREPLLFTTVHKILKSFRLGYAYEYNYEMLIIVDFG